MFLKSTIYKPKYTIPKKERWKIMFSHHFGDMMELKPVTKEEKKKAFNMAYRETRQIKKLLFVSLGPCIFMYCIISEDVLCECERPTMGMLPGGNTIPYKQKG